MTRFLGLLLLTTSLLTVPALTQDALAQDAPKITMGMHHMDITKSDAPEKVIPEKETPQKKEEPAPVTKPEVKPTALKPEEALKKTDLLTSWPYYTDLISAKNDTALDSVLHQVQIDPGSVPPKGLLFLAKALADRDRMEDAAFYYYAAQLRAAFDAVRFPAYEIGPVIVKKDKRTEDQRGETPEATPVLINPHEPVTILAMSVGPKISKWVMSDPVRLDAIMAKVRTWDLATPYAYLPDYDVTHAAPFEQWPKMLVKARDDYFTRVRQVSQGLSRLRPDAPTPSFSHP